ncbi:Der GTPase-activating protein YihI [Alteromonas sp. KUL49]|uniref:Der GTPase-activating protein YihI n=1 Tax=Alteromonas sp. KUL49 TaxID=2480798 RepID=UPI00102F0C3F|nr:Der GTPase-activating protein YihI [Alteromonas sp. KUL49]TAP42069.1 GTPase-activating protein [Alteromonas sp. KUL49]GEA09645.1 Der GTPase-activating protein YihI [Alteromonas sp. KUL49]
MATKSKKSRKIGLIGVRKDPDRKPGSHRNNDARPKKHKGKPAGTRNNVEQPSKSVGRKQENKDPRLGSKKPISLIKVETPTPNQPQKRKYATPAQELAALEADQRLASLLDKLDDDKPLTKEQQAYVDEKMARHRILCDLLGIVEVEDEEEENDPFDSLDAIDIDDFKD